MEELGKKLLEERQLRNISLQDISTATHISVGVLKDIESGKFDKYEGDEEYIKKYIKKYADYLGIESTELIDSYVTLTQEINLSKLKEKDEKLKSEPKKPATTITKPAFAKSPKVYDNHSGRTFVKYTIIVALCLLIVFSVWYALKLSNNSKPGFDNQNQNHISGTPNVDDNEDKVIPPTDETKDENKTPETNTAKAEFSRTAANQYTVKLPAGMDTFTFKIDFVAYTWSSMKVNGANYSNFASKAYNPSNIANDKNANPETVELTFNSKDVNTIVLSNGYNLYHRYYINGEKLDIPESDQTGNLVDVTFTFVKE